MTPLSSWPEQTALAYMNAQQEQLRQLQAGDRISLQYELSFSRNTITSSEVRVLPPSPFSHIRDLVRASLDFLSASLIDHSNDESDGSEINPREKNFTLAITGKVAHRNSIADALPLFQQDYQSWPSES